jgi:hypothetical protein
MAIDFAADLLTMMAPDEFGASATYTPPTGSAVTCRVLIDEGVAVEVAETGAIVREDHATLRVADVPAPVRNATLMVGSNTWTVDAIVERDADVVKVRVSRA